MSEPVVDSSLVNLDKLGDWMSSAGLPDGEFKNQRLLTGGTQNILLYFERGNEAFVLRRPPAHLRDSSNQAMLREAMVLKAIKDTDVPNPGYVGHCEDTDVIGAFFFLMRPVDGFNPTTGLPSPHKDDPSIRRRMAESHVEALIKLGALDYKAIGLESFGKPDGYLERQAPRWLAQLNSYEKLDGYSKQNLPHLDFIVDWISNNVPTGFKPGLIHGDCHLANTMFRYDSGELAALIDWELSTIGDPLIDLGYLICSWREGDEVMIDHTSVEPWDGFLTIPELVKHYRQHSNRNIDSVQWYAVLSCFKLAVILESTYARSCAGKADKSLGKSFYIVVRKLLERANRWIRNGIPE